MLTIAGSGINSYCLKEVSEKIPFTQFDCIVTDTNFNYEYNRNIIPSNVEINFLPFKEVKEFIKDKFYQGKRILYVVTGSPVFFSATGEIIKYLEKEIPGFDPEKVNIIPAESSRDYMLRKLRIPDNDVMSLSLHGRNPGSLDLTKFLATKYTFLLCDELSLSTISEITKYVQDDLVFYMGSKLGSGNEEIKEINLTETAAMLPEEIKKLFVPYVLLVERKYELPDPTSKNEDFATNAGMLTKSDKRAITLQALELKPNLLMWDIGAGSGSVSIDAYKIFKVRTILFEKNQQQCNFIKTNLAKHRVIVTKLVKGNVLENYKDFPKPDRIFIGGGGSAVLQKIIELTNELKDDGLLVANIVGLENLAETVQILRNTELHYDVRSVDIANYKKMSKGIDLSIAEPERTMFQIIIRKGNI